VKTTWTGAREAFRAVNHRRADVAPLVDQVSGRLVGPGDEDCDDLNAPLFPPKYYPETGRFGCVLTRAMIGADCDDKDCDGPDAGEGLSPTVAAEFPAVAALLPSAATDCDDTVPPPCPDCATGLCLWHGDVGEEDCDGPVEGGFLDRILHGDKDCDDEVVRRDALADTRGEP